MKAIFKGMAADREYGSLLLSPSLISVSDIEKAAREQDFTFLPEYCRSAAKAAFEALIKTGDSQLCDALLDASLLENKLKMSEKIKIGMLSDLIKISVFYDNMKAAIRCARVGKSADFCEKCLVSTPPFDKKRIKEATLKGVDAVLALLASVAAYRGADAAAAYKISPSEFEKFTDNLLMSVVIRAKYVAVGPEPLVAYLQAKLAEIKAVRIVASGIATGEDSGKTREMLRELYG
jgi:V/A-type H+-transporting ATPase subunit C